MVFSKTPNKPYLKEDKMGIIIFLALTSYLFDPQLSEAEVYKITSFYQIPPIIERNSKFISQKDSWISLYKKGDYSEYSTQFEAHFSDFGYSSDNKVDYHQLYTFYLLSLKIQKNDSFESQLCLIYNHIEFMDKIPPFFKTSMPSNCSKDSMITIKKGDKFDIYVNGLKINKSGDYYVSEYPYNLSVCLLEQCRYFEENSKNIDEDSYGNYFLWNKQGGRIYLNTIPDQFYKYFGHEIVHLFYKKDGAIYHQVRSQKEILSDETLIFPKSNGKKDFSIIDVEPKESKPIYTTWYFYAITGIVLASVGILGYLYLSENDSKNTKVVWE